MTGEGTEEQLMAEREETVTGEGTEEQLMAEREETETKVKGQRNS